MKRGMSGLQGVAVALIGAAAAVTGSFFTAQATTADRYNMVDTKVEVLKKTQELQYAEVKGSLDRIENKLDAITLPRP